uniref:Coiled-coil domain containing 38 n=1 Tax=Pelodiscus sinensis TaxID=13735 RepID=K7GDL4_PELSI
QNRALSEDKIAQQNLKVHEKSTFSSRAKSRDSMKKMDSVIERETRATIDKGYITSSPNWALTFAKCCQSDKQSLTEYIKEQKELFLLQYTVKVKKQTIKKLEKLATQKEKEASSAEAKLEEDTIAFEEFLKENDRSSTDALKIAAQETKSKMEMVADVKSAINELFAIKSEIANAEILLVQSLYYEDFLMKLSPKEWQEEQRTKKLKAKIDRERESMQRETITRALTPQQEKESACKEKSNSLTQKSKSRTRCQWTFSFMSKIGFSPTQVIDLNAGAAPSAPSQLRSGGRLLPVPPTLSDQKLTEADLSEVPEIYFTDPKQLLHMFTELEEQNLVLIQNNQDLDETLDEIEHMAKIIRAKLEFSQGQMKQFLMPTLAACISEEEKHSDLVLRAKMFCFGEFNPEIQDKLLHSLTKKVAEVYRISVGKVDASSINSIQMLRRIENRIEELCELLESVPKDNIDAIEKIKLKDRRQRLREEKKREEIKLQEERLKCSMERATAAPKKKLGRKLVFRSQPPEIKKETSLKETSTKNQDDILFFT